MTSRTIDLIESLQYEIKDDNDISVETAKQCILDSINVATILQQFESDQFDHFQKEVTLQAIKKIINVIKNYDGTTITQWLSIKA
jgi:hypothetical protein